MHSFLRGALTEFSPLFKGGWGGSKGLKTPPRALHFAQSRSRRRTSRAIALRCRLQARCRELFGFSGQEKSIPLPIIHYRIPTSLLPGSVNKSPALTQP